MGGYVAWRKGDKADGSDSEAYEVMPASHWPEVRAIILVASAEKKDVSSTAGMQQTVASSALFAHRAEVVVPQRMAEMETAVKAKDFEAFADLSMNDSNNFHACCLDTQPPIFYMNDTSRAAVRMVEAINASHPEGKKYAAYTFDAGPNAVVYFLEKDADIVAGTFKTMLGDKTGWSGETGQKIQARKQALEGTEVAGEALKKGISRVILTSVGDGPRKTEEHLC